MSNRVVDFRRFIVPGEFPQTRERDGIEKSRCVVHIGVEESQGAKAGQNNRVDIHDSAAREVKAREICFEDRFVS